MWVLSARKWFVGPLREIQDAERLGVDVSEPGALEAAEAEKGSEEEVSPPAYEGKS